MDDEIKALITAAAARHGTLRKLAAALKAKGVKGLSFGALHGRLHDSYGADTARLDARVRQHLSTGVECPHLDREIGRAECADFAARPMPQSDPAKIRHWAACQACPNRPVQP